MIKYLHLILVVLTLSFPLLAIGADQSDSKQGKDTKKATTCSAPPRGVCDGCSVSCPSNKEAHCKPGTEYCPPPPKIPVPGFPCTCSIQASCVCK